jgi:hypothetical protein
MIFECQYWREKLRVLAADLRGRKHQTRWSGRTEAKVEREVTIGFYMMRETARSESSWRQTPSTKLWHQSIRLQGDEHLLHHLARYC